MMENLSFTICLILLTCWKINFTQQWVFLLGSASCQAVETEWEFLFNLRGLFLQSVGFPFDSQGPGFSRNFLLLLSHYKAIENGNQTCSLGLVGRMTCLALNIYRCGGKHIPCKIRLINTFLVDNAKTRN